MSKKLTLPILLGFLIYMILFPQQTAECVRQTLVLWYRNVLPALLPALLTVHLLLNCNITRFHPESLCMFIGIFCGFPLGCQCVCNAVQKGQISKDKGKLYAVAFNQFSPVFLSSYVATSMLQIPAKTVFMILYTSHLVLFLPLYQYTKKKEQTFIVKKSTADLAAKGPSFISVLDMAIVKSSDTLVKIGGYMLVCTFLRTILQTMVPNNTFLIVLAGCLETTSGIAYTALNCTNEFLMKTLILAFVSFGGLCGFLQVSRSLEAAELDKTFYICFKLLAGVISALLYILLNGLLGCV